jgi:hypothetical protein
MNTQKAAEKRTVRLQADLEATDTTWWEAAYSAPKPALSRRRDAEHFRRMFGANPNASIGFSLAARAVYAARFGLADDPDPAAFGEIARRLKTKFGEEMGASEVLAEMDAAVLDGKRGE